MVVHMANQRVYSLCYADVYCFCLLFTVFVYCLQYLFTAIAVSLPLPSGIFFPIFVIGKPSWYVLV